MNAEQEIVLRARDVEWNASKHGREIICERQMKWCWKPQPIVPEVWVPPVEVRELRSMISYRWRLAKMSTAIQNQMHSLLHRHNIQAPQGKIDTRGESRVVGEIGLERVGNPAFEAGNQDLAIDP